MTYKFEKAKIFIVDDMKPMLELTKTVLTIFGFETIITEEDPNRAYETICKENPDLIITDWLMEPINGLELTEKIRKNPLSPNPYVPILMMTGFSSRLHVENARDIGVTEFIVKPFSAKDLYTRIVQIVEKPRQFIDAEGFFGPDRRRRSDDGYDGSRRRENDESFNRLSQEQQEKAEALLKKLREEAKDT
ncbi:response regulator [Alphaproteobacteria bacterium]|nr:response regulator [Alphaproteobacteria bacterium]